MLTRGSRKMEFRHDKNRSDGTLNYGRFKVVIQRPKPNHPTVFCRPLGVNAISFLQCTDNVGWVTGRVCGDLFATEFVDDDDEDSPSELNDVQRQYFS